MMQRVVSQGTGRRADFGRPAAGKTGTSQNWRDAWFIGFTPDFTAGVWVGDDGGKAMSRVVGGDLPAVIWRKLMIAAEKDLPIRDFTWLVSAPPPPGALAEPDQPDPRDDFFAGLASELSSTAREQAGLSGSDGEEPQAPSGPPPELRRAAPEPTQALPY